LPTDGTLAEVDSFAEGCDKGGKDDVEEAMARFGGERWRKDERLKVGRLKAEEKGRN
jgi:hypothetical protein